MKESRSREWCDEYVKEDEEDAGDAEDAEEM